MALGPEDFKEESPQFAAGVLSRTADEIEAETDELDEAADTIRAVAAALRKMR